ncbi:ABC transporter permease subunit [bacterium]|nr:ABC transporter permease subunit [bacterium]
MWRYALKKLSEGVAIAFGLVTVVFFLFDVLPGDPARMMLGQREDSAQLEALRAKFGFDQPLWVRYTSYLNDLSPLSVYRVEGPRAWSADRQGGVVFFTSGNRVGVLKKPFLRFSYQQADRSVSSILASVFPNTALLALCSLVFAAIVGLGLGIVSALYPHTFLDRFLLFAGSVGMALPSFLSAILIAWIFGFLWHDWTGLPMSGNLRELDDYGEAWLFRPQNLILPAFTLGIRPLGVIAQLVRGNVLEVMGRDMVRTAHSKGLSPLRVLWAHALPNALTPVITAISGWFASMLAGAVFVETIFGWNGLGKEMVRALELLDLPVVMGAVLLIGLVFIVLQLCVDLLFAWLDPRIRDALRSG